MFFFPSKRWDIEIKNGIIIKLPKSNVKKSLNQSFEVLNDEKFKQNIMAKQNFRQNMDKFER